MKLSLISESACDLLSCREPEANALSGKLRDYLASTFQKMQRRGACCKGVSSRRH